MKQTVLIDVDSTLINSVETIFEIYKEETSQPQLKYTSHNQWDFSDLLPESYIPRAIELFTTKKFFDRVQLLPNAYYVLLKYKDKFNLTICSIHDKSTAYLKENYIKEHLPFIKNIIMLPNDGVNFTKSSVKGEIIIDDKISCLTGDRKHRILFGNYGYNTNISEEDMLILKDNPYVRAKDWLEVDKLLSNIYRKDVLGEI